MRIFKKVLICFAFLFVLAGTESVYATENDTPAPYTEVTERSYFTRKKVDGEDKYYLSGVEVDKDVYYEEQYKQRSAGSYSYVNTSPELMEEDEQIYYKMYVQNQSGTWYDSKEAAVAAFANYYKTFPADSICVGFEGRITRDELLAAIGHKGNYYGNYYENIFEYWLTAGRMIYRINSSGKYTVLTGGIGPNTGTPRAEYLQCVQIADQIAAKTAGMDRYNTIKYVADYLANSITYENNGVRHLAGALINKATVCEGYMLAFDLIMERLGIPCYMVTSSNHGWNAVEIDGKYYWVDVTWMDQKTWISYKHFLIGTDAKANPSSLNIVSASSYPVRPDAGSGNSGEGGNSGGSGTTTPQPEDTEMVVPDTSTEETEVPETNTEVLPEETPDTQGTEVPEMSTEGAAKPMTPTDKDKPNIWIPVAIGGGIVFIAASAVVVVVLVRKRKENNIEE